MQDVEQHDDGGSVQLRCAYIAHLEFGRIAQRLTGTVDFRSVAIDATVACNGPGRGPVVFPLTSAVTVLSGGKPRGQQRLAAAKVEDPRAGRDQAPGQEQRIKGIVSQLGAGEVKGRTSAGTVIPGGLAYQPGAPCATAHDWRSRG